KLLKRPGQIDQRIVHDEADGTQRMRNRDPILKINIREKTNRFLIHPTHRRSLHPAITRQNHANAPKGRSFFNILLEEKEAAARTIWDSIDNRFGEMVQDNIFWSKCCRLASCARQTLSARYPRKRFVSFGMIFLFDGFGKHGGSTGKQNTATSIHR
ncbi:MAG: hypothetical protein ACR2KT_15545, partial [Methylocella sp.]